MEQQKRRYIIALDQGTTSSRCIVFDNQAHIVDMVQKEFTQIYPKPGWIEHDPMEIYASQYGVMIETIARCGIRPHHIISIGITNQRETTIVWNKKTGKPIYNAIVWQCRRTAPIVEKINKDKMTSYIKANTGLVPDAYFSATKIKWILDNVEGAKELAEKGELLFGTVDTWLVWKLTNGRVFATDYTNASRTMLFNIKTMKWDKKLCNYFGIPMSMLPEVKPSSADYGYVNIFEQAVPINAVCGDQQSSLFGQGCYNKGDVKNTYGTGCFLLMNCGDKFLSSKNGLLTTLGANLTDKPTYVLEGSVFVGGALMQWIRDQMRFFTDAPDSEYFAKKVPDNGNVYVVPAFTGLGAPYWDMYARGAIFGLTRGTTRNHIIRASLESIAYQTYDVLKAMEADSQTKIKTLKVDGGASKNNFLMQFQSDILDAKVLRGKIGENTALGVCYLAGLKSGIWTMKDLKTLWEKEIEYCPNLNKEVREKIVKRWHKAVHMSMNWEKDS